MQALLSGAAFFLRDCDGDAAWGQQIFDPSIPTLFFRSTRCGNFLPALAIDLLYCFL
jgi:hypothetical protein